MDEYKHLHYNWEKYDHDFIRFLKLDKTQAAYICEQTKTKTIVVTGISTDRGEL